MTHKNVHPAPPPPQPSVDAALTLRERSEARFIENTDLLPDQAEPLSPETSQQLLHELQVHQIELEMEIDELSRTQAALDTSRKRYFDFYDLAPVGYCSVTEQGLISQANLCTAALLGTLRNKLLQQPISRFIARDDQDAFYLFRRKLLDTGDSLSCELRLVNPVGEPFWAQLNALAVADGQGGTALRIVLSDINERKNAELAQRTLLQEKVALLHEVDHRVKNNLQVISSLLHLEARRSNQVDTKTVLHEMQGRVRAMAVLPESLYRSGTFASVDLGAYLKQVAIQSFRAHATRSGAVRLTQELSAVRVGMDQATPCGLLLNELICNAFKHGFPAGQSGAIHVELHPALGTHELWCLRVSDSGVGLSTDFEARRSQSLGLQLVDDLSQQIGGTLAIGPAPLAAFALIFAIQPVAWQALPGAA